MAKLIFRHSIRGFKRGIIGNNAPPPAALTITTTSLPSGEVGRPYPSRFINVIGGTFPYVWSVSAGDLPDGLELNSATGLISGTPTSANFFSFTIQVLDFEENIDTQTYNINIIPTVIPGDSHEFFQSNVSRPECVANYSLRNQLQLSANIRSNPTRILSSTAATPTEVQAGTQPVTIVSSNNSVITLLTRASVAPGDEIYITGSDVSALNGAKTVLSLTGAEKILTIVESVTGNATTGTVWRSNSRVFEGAFVDITDHDGFPTGTYVVRQMTGNGTFTLETTGGAAVTGTGGTLLGTYETGVWEYMRPSVDGGSDRVDPYSDPQDGAKVTLMGSNLLRQLEVNGGGIGSNEMLICWDFWFGEEFHTAAEPLQFLPMKAFRIDDTGADPHYAPKIDYVLKRIPIVDISSSGSGVSLVNSKVPHHLATGDIVEITGNSAVATGEYPVTVLAAQSFTINTTASGTVLGGQLRNIKSIGRFWCLTLQRGGGFRWNNCVDNGDNTFPTGEGTAHHDGKASMPIYWGKWHRFWMHYRQGVKGSEFDSWNATIIQDTLRHGDGELMAYRPVSATVVDTTATFTCTSGPHGYKDGDTVEITGIPGCNGTFIINSVPVTPTASSLLNGGFTGPTTFIITDAAISGSGGSGGHSDMLFNQLSAWIADEDRDPTRVLYQIPTLYEPGTLFGKLRLEFDSSKSGALPSHDYIGYARNLFFLDGYPVDEADTTLFQRPIAP